MQGVFEKVSKMWKLNEKGIAEENISNMPDHEWSHEYRYDSSSKSIEATAALQTVTMTFGEAVARRSCYI